MGNNCCLHSRDSFLPVPVPDEKQSESTKKLQNQYIEPSKISDADLISSPKTVNVERSKKSDADLISTTNAPKTADVLVEKEVKSGAIGFDCLECNSKLIYVKSAIGCVCDSC